LINNLNFVNKLNKVENQGMMMMAVNTDYVMKCFKTDKTWSKKSLT